jgi:FkbM family methyltransferase
LGSISKNRINSIKKPFDCAHQQAVGAFAVETIPSEVTPCDSEMVKRATISLVFFLFFLLISFFLVERLFVKGAGIVESKPLSTQEEKSVPSSGDATSHEPTISIDYARSHSQQLEEQTVISEFFFREGKVLTKGTFIEIGALDGNSLSNTWLLEKDLSWSGLLVEGCPSNFEALTRNRPESILSDKAVCNPVPPSKTVSFSANCAPSSGVMDTEIGDDFIRNVRLGESEMNVDVPCDTMSNIIAEAGLKHVDFFSIDVEGSEAKLVSSIDFVKVSIHVIVIEMDHSSQEDREVVATELTGAGFMSVGFVMGDEIWVNEKNAANSVGVYVPAEERVHSTPTVRILPCRELGQREDSWLSTRDENGETSNFKPYASRLVKCA